MRLGEASITDIANLSTLKLTTATKAVYRLVEDGIVGDLLFYR